MQTKLKKGLLIVAGVLGVLAIVAAFLSALKLEYAGQTENIDYNDIYFGTDYLKGATLPFIGFLLIGIAGIYFLLTSFFGKLDNNIAKIVALVLVVVGVIFVFITKSNWLSINEAPEEAAEMYKLGVGPIIGGICGIIVAIIGAISSFVLKD